MADHTTECPYCAATFEPDELTRLRGAMIESLRRDRSEDTKRLDWRLDHDAAVIVENRKGEFCVYVAGYPIVKGWHPTKRDALDAAMKEERGE